MRMPIKDSMEPELLRLFERELQHLDSSAKAFAADGRYRGLARRLGLGSEVEVARDELRPRSGF